MKRFVSILCSLVLLISITGCADSGDSSIEQILSEEISGEITVSCYSAMEYKAFLELAAKSFEAENPGTTIHVEALGAMPEIKTSESGGTKMQMVQMGDDTQAQSDYINKINTELMGGAGADVLAMDILPYYKYADGGQLEDLSLYMDADETFNRSDYRQNIFDAVKYKGGQYIVPLDYGFNYFAYDSTLFTESENQELSAVETPSYEELIRFAEEPFNRQDVKKKMFGMPAYASRGLSLFEEMFAADYDSFIDIENRTANFTDGNFVNLLESISKYNESGYLQPTAASGPATMDSLSKPADERFFYKTKSHFSLLTDALQKSGSGMQMRFSSGQTLGIEEDDKTIAPASGGSGDAAITYSQGYGINANSTNKALAWAFIKYLLGDEMQESLELSRINLPVNNKARAAKMEMAVTGELFAQGQGAVKVEMDDAKQGLLDEYVAQIEAFSDALNVYPIRDAMIDSIISAEAGDYFNGSKTAIDAARTMQDKIELYLNE